MSLSHGVARVDRHLTEPRTVVDLHTKPRAPWPWPARRRPCHRWCLPCSCPGAICGSARHAQTLSDQFRQFPMTCGAVCVILRVMKRVYGVSAMRSEEHTSELQSRPHLVCRLL